MYGSEEEVKEFQVPILSEIFDYLDQQLKDASLRRTFLLWRLKFLVASRGRYHWSSSQLLTEFKVREDICGLVQTSKIVFESRLDGLADLAVSALMEAVKLEKDEREREKLAAGALEMVSVLSENVTDTDIAWDTAEPTQGRVDLSHYIIPRYYFSFRTSPAGEDNCEGSLRIVTREEDPDLVGYYSFKQDVSVMTNSTLYYKVNK